jgi:hypothetical protein
VAVKYFRATKKSQKYEIHARKKKAQNDEKFVDSTP